VCSHKFVYMRVCAYVFVCVFVCALLCVHVRVYVCLYACCKSAHTSEDKSRKHYCARLCVRTKRVKLEEKIIPLS